MANHNEEYHLNGGAKDESSYTKDREPHLNEDNFSSAAKAGGAKVMTMHDEVGEPGVGYSISNHSSQDSCPESDVTLRSPEASVIHDLAFLSMVFPDEGDGVCGIPLTEGAMRELNRAELARYSGGIPQWIMGSSKSRPIAVSGQAFGVRGSMHANSHRSTSWHSHAVTDASYVLVSDTRQQDEDVADTGALFHEVSACIPRSFDDISIAMEDP